MSDQQQIVFRVILDDNGVPASAQRTTAAFGSIGAASEQASTRTQASARQTAAAMRGLPAQLTDVAVSLQGGQNPFTVLLQQGGQIKDMFGGIRPAAAALAAAIGPVGLAIGTVAVAAGTMAVAFWQGREQSQALQRQIALTGGAADVLLGRVDTLTTSLADMAKVGAGVARDALNALAGSGAFAGSNLEIAGRAVLALQKLSGQSADDIVRDFAGMKGGVAAWAQEHNRAYNFLTAAQLEYIKSLEAQGRAQEAERLTLTELASTMESRTAPALGLLDRALQGASNAWSNFWDKAKGIGRPETIDERISTLQEKIAGMDAFVRKGGYGGNTAFADSSAELETLQKERARRAAAASDRLAQQQAEQDQMLRNSRAFQDSMLAVTSANQAKLLAEETAGAQARRLRADEAYRQRNISAQKYTDEIIATERARINAQIKAAEAAVQVERSRKVEVAKGQAPEQAQAAKDAAVIAAQTRVVGLLSQRAALEAKIRANEFRVAPDAPANNDLEDLARTAFRQAEIRADGARQAAEFAADQRRQSQAAAQELLQGNRALSISLIQDDRARGMAQIAADEDALRKRLNLTALSADERKKVEDDFAQWRVLREQQLTQELIPQWERDAQAWADTVGTMKRRYDDFMQSVVTGGRDAFVQFAETGRVSVGGLLQYMRGEFAKMVYERYLSGYVRQAANFLFNTVMSGGNTWTQPDDVPTRGGRANGGSVPGQSAWVVGERGPEVLVMGRNPGVVVPNHALQGMASQAPIQLVQNFSVRGNEDMATMARMAAMARDQAMAGVADARRRGNAAYSG